MTQLLKRDARFVTDSNAALDEIESRLASYRRVYRDSLATLDTTLRQRLDPQDSLRYRAVLGTVAELRTHHLTLMLAAADTIIDRDSGAIDAQVVGVIDDNISSLADERDRLATLIHESPEQEAVQRLAPQIQSLASGIRNDLAQLITRAAMANQQADEAFAAIDQEIDAHAMTIRSALADLVASAQKQQAAATRRLEAGSCLGPHPRNCLTRRRRLGIDRTHPPDRTPRLATTSDNHCRTERHGRRGRFKTFGAPQQGRTGTVVTSPGRGQNRNHPGHPGNQRGCPT